MKRTHVLYGIIAVLAIIILALLLSPPSQPSAENEQMEDVEIESTPAAINFNGIWHDDWPLLERAQNGVQTLTSGQIVTGYVVEDPNDNDIVYFATRLYKDNDESDAAYDENMVAVYRYNTSNFHFERLYRRTYQTGDLDDDLYDGTLPLFRVVGLDGNNVILLVTAMDDSPGPCTDWRLLGEQSGRQLWSMSISNPYDGFTDYILPDQIRVDAEAQMEACQQELFSN